MSAIVVIEVAKVLLTGYMTYAKQKGLTEEEMEGIYEEAKLTFSKNDPSNLIDV